MNSTKNVMPILTPVYPAFNTTFNVNKTTKNIMMWEFKWASSWLRQIEKGLISIGRFFIPLNFFKAYSLFLWIKVCINKEEDLDKIRGYFESKLKHIVFGFENNETDAIPGE